MKQLWQNRVGRLLAMALTAGTLLSYGCAGSQSALKEAYALLQADKPAEAIDACTKLLEKDPENAEAWSCKGKAELRQGLLDPAIQDFDKAIGFGGKSDSAGSYHFHRGMAHYASAHFEQAVADFEAAAGQSYQPGNSITYAGICQAAQGDDISAIATFNRALKAEPENHFALSNRGFYNAKVGDNKQALADFSKAISIKPDDKVSYLNRGYTYIGMGDYQTAIMDFQKALEIDPEYGGALSYMGIAYTNTNRPKEAIPYLDKAILVEPENATYHYYRGVAKIMAGMVPEGCQDLQFALEHGDGQGSALMQQYCR